MKDNRLWWRKAWREQGKSYAKENVHFCWLALRVTFEPCFNRYVDETLDCIIEQVWCMQNVKA